MAKFTERQCNPAAKSAARQCIFRYRARAVLERAWFASLLAQYFKHRKGRSGPVHRCGSVNQTLASTRNSTPSGLKPAAGRVG